METVHRMCPWAVDAVAGVGDCMLLPAITAYLRCHISGHCTYGCTSRSMFFAPGIQAIYSGMEAVTRGTEAIERELGSVRDTRVFAYV